MNNIHVFQSPAAGPHVPEPLSFFVFFEQFWAKIAEAAHVCRVSIVAIKQPPPPPQLSKESLLTVRDS